jgi:hypothetical protein
MRKEMSCQIAEEASAPFASSTQGVRNAHWNEHLYSSRKRTLAALRIGGFVESTEGL